jgi:hypothetical protein
MGNDCCPSSPTVMEAADATSTLDPGFIYNSAINNFTIYYSVAGREQRMFKPNIKSKENLRSMLKTVSNTIINVYFINPQYIILIKLLYPLTIIVS